MSVMHILFECYIQFFIRCLSPKFEKNSHIAVLISVNVKITERDVRFFLSTKLLKYLY